MKVTIKHRLEYAVVRMLMLGLGWLPKALAYGGIAAMGQLFFLCSKRRQEYALRFLRRAYPEGKSDRELLALARRATGNFLKVSMDMVLVQRLLRKGTLPKYVDGIADLRAATGEGPVLIVTGHLGSWEVGLLALTHAREEAHVIGRVFKNPLLQQYMENSRRSFGLHLHSRRGGIRGLARALKNGAVAVQAVDQNQRLRGVFVPFFGKLASTERAAATLAVRQGYPVVMTICTRIGKGFRFKLQSELIRPGVPRDNEDIADEVKRLVCEINAVMERLILEYPEQYLWIHDRYRTEPGSGAVPVSLLPEAMPKAK